MWLSATGRIGLLLAILFVVFGVVYLRRSKESFVISNDALIERNQKGIKCPKGSFCPPLSGKAFLCPGGTYGEAEGLITAACSGLCEPGYICDAGSVSKTAKQCPGGFYCIAGTASVGPITPTICPEGYFCPPGSPAPQKCGEMETCPEGTGACPPGNTACGGTPQPGPVNTPTSMGSKELNQALFEAIIFGNEENVKLALTSGANSNAVNATFSSDAYKRRLQTDASALWLAVLMRSIEQRNEEIIKILINKGADLNWKNKYNDSILDIAKRYAGETSGLIEILKKAGAK